MQRSKTHQIDEAAQRVLRDAIPTTWLINDHKNDYGKDYLLEVGEDNGYLTGSSFYVQLKGHNRADFSNDGSVVRHPLESKYAAYYLDKIEDLPVFLVVVDVTRKKGWWLFLQPVLDADQRWRKQRSITVCVPTANDMADTASLRKAAEDAKQWMRRHHPESIQDAVAAHKEQIAKIDPRFEVSVSLVDGSPAFTLTPKESVHLNFQVSGDHPELLKKTGDLVDRGQQVSFLPGELKIIGSKLFEQMEETGGAMQLTIQAEGTLTLACRDESGVETASLTDIPGQFSGGQKAAWFSGGLNNSPLKVKLGPIGPAIGGSARTDIKFDSWDGQLLCNLAYFDRISKFFRGLPASSSTSIECQLDGNAVLSVALPLQEQPFAIPLATLLDLLAKARAVCQRVGINPVWKLAMLDDDTQETIEELHAIVFGTGYTKPRPNLKLTAECVRKTFNFEAARKADSPTTVKLISEECTMTLFGEAVQLGKLVQEYTDVTLQVEEEKPAHRRKVKGRGVKTTSAQYASDNDPVVLVLNGTKTTIWSVRRATEKDGN